MSKKSYVLHFSMIVGVTTALLLFIFILVSHHRTMPERVVQDRGALLATGSPMMTEPAKPAVQADVPAAKPKRAPAKKVKAAPPSPR